MDTLVVVYATPEDRNIQRNHTVVGCAASNTTCTRRMQTASALLCSSNDEQDDGRPVEVLVGKQIGGCSQNSLYHVATAYAFCWTAYCDRTPPQLRSSSPTDALGHPPLSTQRGARLRKIGVGACRGSARGHFLLRSWTTYRPTWLRRSRSTSRVPQVCSRFALLSCPQRACPLASSVIASFVQCT